MWSAFMHEFDKITSLCTPAGKIKRKRETLLMDMMKYIELNVWHKFHLWNAQKENEEVMGNNAGDFVFSFVMMTEQKTI